MGMKDPIPTFSYFVRRLKELYPDFAFVHLVEPRVDGTTSREIQPGEVSKAVVLFAPDNL